MSQTKFIAGDAVAPMGFTGGDDGTLVLQTGAAGSKVNAVSYAADGTPTFLKSGMVRGTPVATTSGTSILFSGIPSWAKRITLQFAGVGTSGTSIKQVQIGSGSLTTSGYASGGSIFAASSLASTSPINTGLCVYSAAASERLAGSMVLTLENAATNTWVETYTFSNDNATSGYYQFVGGGRISLSGVLDRLSLTTVNGTDTFVAGECNILYEG